VRQVIFIYRFGHASHSGQSISISRSINSMKINQTSVIYNYRDLKPYQLPDEPRCILVVAGSLTQARALLRTIVDMFRVPLLAPLVLGEPTLDEIKLVNGVILRAVPCSERVTRGLPASTVIFEELASYTDTAGHQSGESVYRALAPSVAPVKEDGRVVAVSSPRAQRGVFYRLYQRQDAYVLHCPTWELNPDIDRAFLEREREADPDSFAQEYEASFTAIWEVSYRPKSSQRPLNQSLNTYTRRGYSL